MKLRKMVFTTLSASLLLLGTGVTAVNAATSNSSSTTNTTAETKKYVKTFPKAMQTTWYSYNKKTGYTAVKLTKNQLTVTNNGKTNAKITLHAYKQHDAKKVTKDQENWIYAWQTGGWLETYDWDQQYGSGSYFKVQTVNKHKTLSIRSMQSNVDSGTYYQTKQLAKKYSNQKSANSNVLM